MQVRDAREADADALAAIADAPTDVMRNLVHDRTVRVAEPQGNDPDPSETGDRYGRSDPDDILGFVSFDARRDTVYVTQLRGSPDACDRLLEEPIGFARGESMAVELLMPASLSELIDVAAGRGFIEEAIGPRFEGEQTVRLRWEPELT